MVYAFELKQLIKRVEETRPNRLGKRRKVGSFQR